MHWAIEKEDRTDSDPTGVDGFVKRMESELRGDGPPMEGFHFLNTPMDMLTFCLLYTSPSPRDKRQSRMPSSA